MTGLAVLDVSSLLSYVVAVVFPALDVVFPVLPSETAIITLGVATAGSADPRIVVLIALAAFGAFLGDNVVYLLGRRFGPAISKRVFAGERGGRRHAWAQRSLERYGARLIVACRFIPGGRTAVTLTCGLVGYPRRRFVVATACAGVIWASYAFFIGRLGGKAFEDRPWAGLLLALGAALVISALIEVARRAWQWWRSRRASRRPDGGDEPPGAGPGDHPRVGGHPRAGDHPSAGGHPRAGHQAQRGVPAGAGRRVGT
jgi:membrane-associated protein